jgi:NAD(P)H-hydrate epimerase
MEILTGEQMRLADRHAIDVLGVPSLLLMEAAGRGVAEALRRDMPRLAEDGVLILCGKGNNGGDGLVVARHHAGSGVRATVGLLARARDLKGDAAQNRRAAVASGIVVEEAPDERAWTRRAVPLERFGVVVDAILGTGATGGARGLFATVIGACNDRARRVAAIDIPSGMDADSTRLEGVVLRAHRTYTLCRPKLPLVLGATAALAGRWSVVPIGIPDASVAAVGATLDWLDADAVRGILAERADDDHKGTFGHLLVVAGSRGQSGAAVLAGRGALRAGVGLVTVACPALAQGIIAAQQAEMMTAPLPETAKGGVAVL